MTQYSEDNVLFHSSPNNGKDGYVAGRFSTALGICATAHLSAPSRLLKPICFFQGTPYKSLYKILRTLLISHLPFPRKKCFKQDKDSPCAQVLRFAWNVMIFLLVSFPRETSPEGNLLTKTRGEMLTTVCSSCLQCILEFEWPLFGQSRRRHLWLVLLWKQSPS